MYYEIKNNRKFASVLVASVLAVLTLFTVIIYLATDHERAMVSSGADIAIPASAPNPPDQASLPLDEQGAHGETPPLGATENVPDDTNKSVASEDDDLDPPIIHTPISDTLAMMVQNPVMWNIAGINPDGDGIFVFKNNRNGNTLVLMKLFHDPIPDGHGNMVKMVIQMAKVDCRSIGIWPTGYLLAAPRGHGGYFYDQEMTMQQPSFVSARDMVGATVFFCSSN